MSKRRALPASKILNAWLRYDETTGWLYWRKSPTLLTMPQRNTSGYRGVSWHASRKKWVAGICLESKYRVLGRFDRVEDAAAAYVNAANDYWAGRRACRVTASGYNIVPLYGCNHIAHRIVWKMLFKEEPFEIDHINGDRSDNRAKNLRSATRLENARNTKLKKNNKTGTMGVSQIKETGRWRARMSYRNKALHVGVYDTYEEAVIARREAERRMGYHPNHGRRT